MNTHFRRFARAVSSGVGSPYAFVAAVTIVIAWAVTGPFFGFSENWQLIINTGTTIVTFLVVFMIQNTQNRDSRALHLKLDELIRVVSNARNELVDVEDKEDAELDRLQEEFKHLDDIRDPSIKSRREARSRAAKRARASERARHH